MGNQDDRLRWNEVVVVHGLIERNAQPGPSCPLPENVLSVQMNFTSFATVYGQSSLFSLLSKVAISSHIVPPSLSPLKA